jgi:formylglycine-generating enzyme required for sulfatase activity
MTSCFTAKPPKALLSSLFFTCCLSATTSGLDEAGDGAPPTAVPVLGQKAGQVRDDNGLVMKLVWCPRGTVTMETVEIRKEPAEVNPKGLPRVTVHKIRVKAFVTACWMGKYEVTRSEWNQVMRSEPWKSHAFGPEGNDFPATHVSWEDAVAFCTTLTQQERRAGRLPESWEYTLPTEAQWERACRARTETEFCFGDDASGLRDYGWFNANTMEEAAIALRGQAYAHRVGQLRPNAWGLYDMHGNVSEWCKDDYVETVRGGVNPVVTTDGPERVVRGGSWNDNPSACRSSHRFGSSPSRGYTNGGFRVALCAVRQATPGEGRTEPASNNK